MPKVAKEKGFAPLVIIFLGFVLVFAVIQLKKNIPQNIDSDAATLPLYCSDVGDANQDGLTNKTDYNIMARHFGLFTNRGSRVGDFNCDGRVDIFDYAIWLDHATYNGTPPPVPSPLPTPTPTFGTDPPYPSRTPTSAPCVSSRGDANSDGQINIIDYQILYNNYGLRTDRGSATGDFNCDGIVNIFDYNIWVSNATYSGTPPPVPPLRFTPAPGTSTPRPVTPSPRPATPSPKP